MAAPNIMSLLSFHLKKSDFEDAVQILQCSRHCQTIWDECITETRLFKVVESINLSSRVRDTIEQLESTIEASSMPHFTLPVSHSNENQTDHFETPANEDKLNELGYENAYELEQPDVISSFLEHF